MSTKRACDRCHRLKQTCDSQLECSACVRASISCTYERPVAKMGRPRAPKDKVDQKTKSKYSHNACAGCKKRKQKCDEKWPTCSMCSRLGIKCSGPLKIIRVTPEGSETKYTNTIVSEGVVGGASPAVKDLNSGPLESELLGRLSPMITDVFSSSAESNINIMDLTGDLFNDENSLLSSKEKLFLNSLIRSPTFAIDIPEKEPNSELETQYHSRSQLTEVSPDSVEGAEVYEQEKSMLISSCLLKPCSIPAKELELLEYFITDVSSLLFVDKTSTAFLRTVVPLSIEDPNVRYPVIGISASHRSNSNLEENVEYARDAAIYRAKAQSLFIANTVDYFQDSENLLLSILLLAIQEIFEGTSLYWGFALEKAAQIIGKRGGLAKVSSFAPLSIQLFCYLDLISSLSTCSTPYVDNMEFGGYDEDHIERILNSKFGFKFGIAGEIFKVIGNISTLASLRTSRYDSKENEKKFNSLATLIEMRLQNWSPSLDGKRYQIDNSLDDGKLMLSKFTVALQWSAFLRLHQIRNGYNRKDPRVEACLDLILSSTKQISTNSDLETGLMFPLIMAGSVAYKTDDRTYIMSRIRKIKERLKFNYLGEFEKLILRVWESDNQENHSVNWAKIRYFQYPGLVMF
ncbi:hypothetical protein PSN45_005170 [Yamadazyma tenuis]|nr:hypothetical protein PSN45_005170 [Yamadazyma tenuis]